MTISRKTSQIAQAIDLSYTTKNEMSLESGIVRINGSGIIDILNINNAFTLPTSDGSSDQYLKTDGAGNVTWSSVSSGPGVTINNSGDNRILTSTGSTSGINAESNLTFDGTNLTTPILISSNASGDEGGEIQLTKPPNATISGNIIIDVYQNKIRFFEQSGTNRGYYLDITSGGAGVSAPLGTGGGGGGGGITDIIQDTTPQLGGNLDLNNYSITSSFFQAGPSGTIVGQSGWIYQSGQTVLSNGSFGNSIGDAQFSNYLLRVVSTGTEWSPLLNNGNSGILLASNRTFQFSVNIVGRRINGQDNAAYKLEGFVVNDGYGCEIIGNPIKTIFGESDSLWDVRATTASSGTSNYLFIETMGSANKTINWLGKVDLLEVGGNIDGYTLAHILKIPSFTVP